MLVNNAGSLGHISSVAELPSLSALRSEVDFNVTAALWLSSRFAAVFGARKADKGGDASPPKEAGASGGDGEGGVGAGGRAGGAEGRDVSDNVVVNVSSLAALQPFETWGGYSSGKAARNMFHRRGPPVHPLSP